MFESINQAIQTAKNSELPEKDRELAIYFLQEHPSASVFEALIAIMQDDDVGVRWCASGALAAMGDAGIPALLQALTTPSGDNHLLREGAYRVLHDNASPAVRQQAKDLLEALKGPSADVATMLAAYKLQQTRP